MTLYAMKKQARRSQIHTVTVPTARLGSLGEHLSGLTLMVVSTEQAERNRQLEEGRKLAAREAREEREAQARARIAADKVETLALPAADSPMTMETPKVREVRVVRVATPEESAALRAEINRREAATFKGGLHADVLADKARLLSWVGKTKPSISAFVEAILEIGFIYSHDDRNAAVYTREGVEIRAFGAAMNADHGGTRFNKRLTPEQEKSRNRRTQQSAPVAPSVTVSAATGAATSQTLSAEDRTKMKAANIRIAEEQRKAAEEKRATLRLLRKAKAKPIKVPKKEQKADKSAKGGKSKLGDKK
jgi:hypothetical protein